MSTIIDSSKKESYTWLYVSIAIFVACAIGVGIYIFINKNKCKTDCGEYASCKNGICVCNDLMYGSSPNCKPYDVKCLGNRCTPIQYCKDGACLPCPDGHGRLNGSCNVCLPLTLHNWGSWLVKDGKQVLRISSIGQDVKDIQVDIVETVNSKTVKTGILNINDNKAIITFPDSDYGKVWQTNSIVSPVNFTVDENTGTVEYKANW
jgi:hypothetical protein